MREASGDLNLTVIVVVAVAGLMAFFSMTLWPMIKGNMQKDADCSDAVCDKSWTCDGKTTGKICCHNAKDASGTKFACPYKG